LSKKALRTYVPSQSDKTNERQKGEMNMTKNQRIPEERMNFTSTIAQALKNVANGGTLTGVDTEKIKHVEQELSNEEK
jgi:hypothetical protein